jgi:hypothetical protein
MYGQGFPRYPENVKICSTSEARSGIDGTANPRRVLGLLLIGVMEGFEYQASSGVYGYLSMPR